MRKIIYKDICEYQYKEIERKRELNRIRQQRFRNKNKKS